MAAEWVGQLVVQVITATLSYERFRGALHAALAVLGRPQRRQNHRRAKGDLTRVAGTCWTPARDGLGGFGVLIGRVYPAERLRSSVYSLLLRDNPSERHRAAVLCRLRDGRTRMLSTLSSPSSISFCDLSSVAPVKDRDPM